MSSGFRSLKRDGSCPPMYGSSCDRKLEVALLTRTPSMMSSGSFASEMLLAPRMRMRELPPVVPVAWVTVSPETRDCSTSEKLFTAAWSTESALILPTLFPDSRASCVSPVAVTTI
jgi:hypothetical protein